MSDGTRRYLGDGVYAEFDGNATVLFVGEGCNEQRIAVEPEVIAALVQYDRDHRTVAKLVRR